MVKTGFIVEGNTEKIIIDSPQFKEFLRCIGITAIEPVIDAKGNGNLLPQNIEPFIALLKKSAAEKIIVITDADQNSIAQVGKRILPDNALYKVDLIVVAVKAFEAWFLANEELIRKILCIPDFSIDFPEQTEGLPFDYLKDLARSRKVRGPGTKTSFAKRAVKSGFSLEVAAAHPHCPSATYFLNKLKSFSRSQPSHRKRKS